MTKQDEIREGVEVIVGCFAFNKPWCSLTEAQQECARECSREIIKREASQGVVIKVERKLPDCDNHVYGILNEQGRVAQKQMLKAGYVAVEPLIEEEE
ncbi:hypothetical protein LCGC14_1460180 [marine sediment metagenome]|uniref:Uncharacterized protein n=1 Tax=marine sediment metagenome TaxID=412755 RepID=A0A0F9JFB2_9ZZZZ